MVDLLTGTFEIAAVFLSIVAGLVALSLFHVSHRNKELNAWRYLIVSLVLFALEEIFGALNSFKIYETTFLTHIIPTAILGFLICALVVEIHYVGGDS